jgi:hypothetical protein
MPESHAHNIESGDIMDDYSDQEVLTNPQPNKNDTINKINDLKEYQKETKLNI